MERAIGLDACRGKHGAESDGAFAIKDAALRVKRQIPVDEFGVVELILRSDGVGGSGLAIVEQTVAAEKGTHIALPEQECRRRLETRFAHGNGSADGLTLPVDRILGYYNTDVGRVEIVGKCQQCQLVDGGAFVQQTHSSIKMIEPVCRVDTHGAGKAKGRGEGEVCRVSYQPLRHADPLGVGSYLGHIDRLFLFVDTNIVDGSLAAILHAILHQQVALVEEVEAAVAREEQLSVGNGGEESTFGDMKRVASRCNERIGHRQRIDVVVGQFQVVVLIGAVDGMEADVVECRGSALEQRSRHTVEAFAAFMQRKGFRPLGLHALAVV